MGNNQSAIDPVHLRMYTNIIQIKDPLKRLGIINTCLASIEYVSSAKRAGIYSYLLNPKLAIVTVTLCNCLILRLVEIIVAFQPKPVRPSFLFSMVI